MPFTQLRYQNGGGGGGSDLGNLAPPSPPPAVPPSLHGPWNWLAWAQFPNQQHLITDLDILFMEPAAVVELYYSLGQYSKAHEGGLSYDWEAKALPVVSDGLAAGEVEGYEFGLRSRIYTLRGDLHQIQLPDGTWVNGLADLSHVRTIPEIGLTTGGQIFKYILVAASSIVTAGAGTWISVMQLLQGLTTTALKLSSDLRAMKEKLELIDAITAGAYAIVGKEFRSDLLGLRVNLLDYSAAVNIPTSSVAWELALSIGLPHPAMICAEQPRLCLPLDTSQICTFPFWKEPAAAPCSPYMQAWFLLRLANMLKAKIVMNTRRAVEDAIRFNGKWKLRNQLEFFTNAGVPRVGAIIPTVFEVGGRAVLQDMTTGAYVDPREHAELSAILDWLALRAHPEIAKPLPEYGPESPLSRIDSVSGRNPPPAVLADMARALPLTPPLAAGGPAGPPVVSVSPPVNPVPGVPVPSTDIPGAAPPAAGGELSTAAAGGGGGLIVLAAAAGLFMLANRKRK